MTSPSRRSGRTASRGKSGDRRGSVAVFAALAMPALLGAVAIGLEVGSWSVTRIRLQRAADLAAFAGVARLITGDAQAVRIPDACTARNTRSDCLALIDAADVAALNGVTVGAQSWGTKTL